VSPAAGDASPPGAIGLVGCGTISPTYLRTLGAVPQLVLGGCADVDADAAAARARRYRLPAYPDAAALLDDPAIGVVVNLTPPAAHAAVCEAALRAGKHVYTEKPLAASFADGRRLLELARSLGLRLGAAPDTFLGPGWQTARRLVDEGVIGEPVAAEASFLSHGTESWHPQPAFYYGAGGGPLLDMGPYYLTGLVSLLGPVRRVAASTSTAFAERVVGTGPRAGERIPVDVPTHVAGTLEFASGALGTITTSFDVFTPRWSTIVLYGREATLALPDPNGFRGRMRLWSPASGRWQQLPLDPPARPIAERGLGVLDLCEAIAAGRDHLASGALALHILEVMHALIESARAGAHQLLTTTCERPARLSEVAA
jgi:predicted dehydrogenase